MQISSPAQHISGIQESGIVDAAHANERINDDAAQEKKEPGVFAKLLESISAKLRADSKSARADTSAKADASATDASSARAEALLNPELLEKSIVKAGQDSKKQDNQIENLDFFDEKGLQLEPALFAQDWLQAEQGLTGEAQGGTGDETGAESFFFARKDLKTSDQKDHLHDMLNKDASDQAAGKEGEKLNFPPGLAPSRDEKGENGLFSGERARNSGRAADFLHAKADAKAVFPGDLDGLQSRQAAAGSEGEK